MYSVSVTEELFWLHFCFVNCWALKRARGDYMQTQWEKKRWGLNFSYFYSVKTFLSVFGGQAALLVGIKLTQICLTWLLLLQAALFVRAAFIARPPPRSSPALFFTSAAMRLDSPQKKKKTILPSVPLSLLDRFLKKHRWLNRGSVCRQ